MHVVELCARGGEGGGSEKSFSFLVVISPPPPPPKPWRHLCSYRQQHNSVQPRAPHFVAPPTKWLRRKGRKDKRNGSTWRFGHRVFRKIERFETYFIVFGNFWALCWRRNAQLFTGDSGFPLPPPFWVFEVFERQQRFFGAQLEVFKKRWKEGGSPLLRFAGGREGAIPQLSFLEGKKRWKYYFYCSPKYAAIKTRR